MEFINELFEEIKKRRETQHLYTEEDYYDLIEEVLSDKEDLGELPEDFDEKQVKEDLKLRWREFEGGEGK